MKHLLPFALLSCSSILCADEVRMRNVENRLTSLENSQNNCCMVNPPARPYNPDCWGFYVNVDPLIWQAHVNGTGIGIQTNGSTAFLNSAGQSRVQHLNYDWDWGFRLGIGLNLDYDAWDVLLQWTRWNTDAKRSVSSGTNQAIYSHYIHPVNTDSSFSSVTGNWKMNYNMLDLECAREFWVSKYVSFRPFGGFRSAWIDQKEFDITFEDATATKFNVNQSDRYWGFGIRSGLDTRWGLGCGFSLFNNVAGNLLYSFHSVKHREIEGSSTLFDAGDFFHFGSAILDMQIGLRYDWFSCDCCYHLGLDLGWEQHWHPGQNQYLLFADDVAVGQFVANQGDLGIQGYFLKIRFDF